MAKKELSKAQESLAKLIRDVLNRVKNGKVQLNDVNLEDLFVVGEYQSLREQYRELLVKTVFFDDENPLKKAAFGFISKVIEESGKFDMSVILAMAYHQITPLASDLLCKYADTIGGEEMAGYVIYNALKRRLSAGAYYDVKNNVHSVLSPDDVETISKIVDAYRKFAR